MQKNEIGPLPHPHTKINSKWIKNLSVRVKAIKLLKRSKGVNLSDLGLSNGF